MPADRSYVLAKENFPPSTPNPSRKRPPSRLSDKNRNPLASRRPTNRVQEGQYGLL